MKQVGERRVFIFPWLSRVVLIRGSQLPFLLVLTARRKLLEGITTTGMNCHHDASADPQDTSAFHPQKAVPVICLLHLTGCRADSLVLCLLSDSGAPSIK